MKSLLFRALSLATVGAVWVSDHAFAAILWAITAVAQLVRVAVASAGNYLLQKLCPEQYAEVQGQIELEDQQTELDLLASVTKLKEHALETGEWTESHTEAIEAIGQALFHDCDWEEEHVHQYLKEVVESIPGLEYGVPEDPFDGLLD